MKDASDQPSYQNFKLRKTSCGKHILALYYQVSILLDVSLPALEFVHRYLASHLLDSSHSVPSSILTTSCPHPRIHSASSTSLKRNYTVAARETTLPIAHARSPGARIRLISRLWRPPKNRCTALALDARDLNRVALRRERE